MRPSATIPGTVADARSYAAERGWPVFPCAWQGSTRKRPLLDNGFHSASRDPAQIAEWWRRWPQALIGVPTGRRSGFVVVDVDRKRGEDGMDTLEEIGVSILPETPIAHTPSGGLHLYFTAPPGEVRNTAGARGRGLGRGLDFRGDGGYVIVPSPSTGYRWDAVWNLATAPLAALPAWGAPREIEIARSQRPASPSTGLSPYAEAALDDAARRIITAPNGEQEATLNAEAYSIGTLAGAGAVPVEFARSVLHWAAARMPSYDPHRPWRPSELRGKVERAFADGVRSPRQLR